MIVLDNEFLTVQLSEDGAELRSVYDKNRQKEKMWDGDPQYWSRISPVLFPIVGQLKDNRYLYGGKEYQLSRHGFLRDQTFSIVSQDEEHVCFGFDSNEQTYQVYPFNFRVEILYELNMRSVRVTWKVINLDEEMMYYSIGGHPAFRLDKDFPYRFTFPINRRAKQVFLKDGLVHRSEDVELSSIDIEPEMFKGDALIFEHVDAIVLEKKNSNESVRLNFKDFPYVGLWSPYEDGEMAPFVCIEPWHGIADTYHHNHKLEDKKGICSLAGQEEKSYTYTMVFQ